MAWENNGPMGRCHNGVPEAEIHREQNRNTQHGSNLSKFPRSDAQPPHVDPGEVKAKSESTLQQHPACREVAQVFFTEFAQRANGSHTGVYISQYAVGASSILNEQQRRRILTETRLLLRLVLECQLDWDRTEGEEFNYTPPPDPCPCSKDNSNAQHTSTPLLSGSSGPEPVLTITEQQVNQAMRRTVMMFSEGGDLTAADVWSSFVRETHEHWVRTVDSFVNMQARILAAIKYKRETQYDIKYTRTCHRKLLVCGLCPISAFACYILGPFGILFFLVKRFTNCCDGKIFHKHHPKESHCHLITGIVFNCLLMLGPILSIPIFMYISSTETTTTMVLSYNGPAPSPQ